MDTHSNLKARDMFASLSRCDTTVFKQSFRLRIHWKIKYLKMGASHEIFPKLNLLHNAKRTKNGQPQSK